MTVHQQNEPLPAAPAIQIIKLPAGEGVWQRAVKRFRRHRLAIIGAAILIILIFLAVFAPVISVYDPYEMSLPERNLPPSTLHWLGTDGNGRDVWTRVIYGGQVSLSVGLVAVSISTIISIFVGGLSGFFGGRVDMILMRITDMVMTFPLLVIVITLVAITGPSIYNVMVAIGLLSWPGMARLIRGQFLSLREMDYVLAARSIGVGSGGLIVRHLLPNTVGTIAVAATFAVSEAILLEAALSFLGLGVQVPTPSWGSMLRDAQTLSILETRPWMWLPPGIAIMLAVLSVNFIGDGLRDALDPRTIF
ncbi:MAG: ABC transporter permease [Burkholderiales bacterium]|nr:ABC transporter permease [Anaerolineae bacterium]